AGADETTRASAFNCGHGHVLVEVRGDPQHRFPLGESLIAGTRAAIGDDETRLLRQDRSGSERHDMHVGWRVELLEASGSGEDCIDRQLADDLQYARECGVAPGR